MIGAQIRYYREQCGMTQTELARAIGCTQQNISGIEKGNRSVNPDMLRPILQALGLTDLNLLIPEPGRLERKGSSI